MRIAVCSGVLVALAFSAACVDDQPSAFVKAALLPTNDCVFDAESEVVLLSGLYDVSTGPTDQCWRSYQVRLQVVNQLIERGEPQGPPPRSEPNWIRFTEAEVTLIDPLTDEGVGALGDAPNPFTVVTNAVIPAGEDADPGLGVASVEVIPRAYAGLLQAEAINGATVIADIRLFGATLAGTEIETASFRFPIELCDGCLYICLADPTVDPAALPTDVCDDNAGADGRPCVDTSPACAGL